MIYEAIGAFVALGIAALVVATIWSRKDSWLRPAAVAGFFTILPATGALVFYTLSHPAPLIPVVSTPGGEYQVIGTKLVQDEAIYLWLDMGRGHPRYYALPWDNKTADRLQDMINQQKRGKIPGFTAKVPFKFSWDRHPPEFHPMPQPVIPIPKRRQQEPQRYERGA